MAAVDFFYLTIYLTQILLLIPEVFLGMFHYIPNDEHRNRQD